MTDILEKIIQFFATDFGSAISVALIVLWSVLKAAKVIVSLTKTTADDKVVEQIEKILLLLGQDPTKPKTADEIAGELKKTPKLTTAQKFWKAI